MSKLSLWISLGIVAVTITLLPVYLSSRAAPAAQYTPPPPRPTVTPRPTNTPPGSPPPPRPTPVPSVPPRPTPEPSEPPPRPTPSDTESLPVTGCGVHGQVWQWERNPAAQIAVRLEGQSWSTQTVSDGEGRYSFRDLGQGLALLNLMLPEGFVPLTTDVALRLGYVSDLTVNLGFYAAGETPDPEPIPVLSAERDTALPGETLVYWVHLRYRADAESTLSGVLLTDLLPEGLRLIGVETSRGSVETWGNLLTVDLGNLSPGDEVEVTITAQVAGDVAPGTVLSHRVTLISAETAATQSAEMSITVGEGGPAVLPETGGSHPD